PKSDSPDPVIAGGTLTYTLTVSNAGPSTSSNVTVTDTLSPGVTFQSASGTGWSCSQASGTVTCTRASLAPTGSTSSTITILVTAPNEGGTITNTASVSSATPDPNPANNSATEQTTVIASADLSITKTGPTQVDAGASFNYTLTVTNLGPSTATQIQVTDQPLGATITAVSPSGGGFTCGLNTTTNTATCSGGMLSKTAQATITLTVKAPDEGGTVTNAATVSAHEVDSNPANNTSATVTTSVRAVADLAITKTGPAQVDAGASFNYTLTVTNNGPSTATQIQVTDQPLGATITAVSASGGSFTCAFSTTTNTATCSGGTLSKTAQATITLTVKAPDAGGTVTNAATVSGHEVDSNPANNTSATVTTSVRAVADLAITKTGPAQVDAGASFNYTLTVTNNGPSTATQIQVTDQPLGATITAVSASGGSFTCAFSTTTNTATCSGGTLSKTAQATITLTVKAPDAGGTVTNAATVSGHEVDSNPANNTSATVTTSVRAVADLAITKTGPAQVDAGASFNYTLTVTNNGPSTATQIQVTDQPLGATITAVSASGGSFTCAFSTTTNTATCSGGTLSKTAQATITLTVKAPDAGGTVTNAATVSGHEVDSNPANNTSATVTTSVRAVADLAITKTGPAQVDAGASFNYTLTVTNNGPSTATQIQVTDQPLGATITAVSASGGSFTCAFSTTTNTATCSGGTLSKTAQATITLTVKAPDAGGTVTNAATVSGHEVDSNPANNTSATVTTSVRAVADLSITKTDSPDPVRPGGILTYTVSVANAGPSAAANVRMDDLLPSQTTFRSVTSPAGWTCTTPMVGMTGTVSCTTTSLA